MSDDLRALAATGRQYFENRDYERALNCLNQVVEAGRRWPDVLNMLGIIYHAEGRFSNAIECFEEALKGNPQYTEAALHLAVLYNDLGQYKQAKALYERVHKKPKDKKGGIEPTLKGKLSNLHADLGDLYRGIGFYAEAVDEYRKALSLNDDYADIRTKLGVALREIGKKKESCDELQQALKLRPSYLQARIQLGLTLFTMGKSREAAHEWDAVLKKDPENPLAQSYRRLCDNGKAKSATPATARKGR